MRPSGEYWGLHEADLVGTVSLGAHHVAATCALRFEDEQTASLAVVPVDAAPFSIVFTWTWWPETREAWISAVSVSSGPHQIGATSTGQLRDGVLHLELRAAEAIELAGATGTQLTLDARLAS